MRDGYGTLADLIPDVDDVTLLLARLLVDVIEDRLVEFELERANLGRALLNDAAVAAARLELADHIVIYADGAVRPISSLY